MCPHVLLLVHELQVVKYPLQTKRYRLLQLLSIHFQTYRGHPIDGISEGADEEESLYHAVEVARRPLVLQAFEQLLRLPLLLLDYLLFFYFFFFMICFFWDKMVNIDVYAKLFGCAVHSHQAGVGHLTELVQVGVPCLVCKHEVVNGPVF